MMLFLFKLRLETGFKSLSYRYTSESVQIGKLFKIKWKLSLCCLNNPRNDLKHIKLLKFL